MPTSWKTSIQERILPFPWITPISKIAMKVYSLKYGHFPNFGFQMDFTKDQVPYLVQPNPTHLARFIIVNSLLLLIKFSALTHKWNHLTQPYRSQDIIQLAFLFLGILWILFVSVLVRVELFRERRSISVAVNKLLSGNTRIRKTANILDDISGLLLLYMVTGASFIGPILPILLRYLKADVWYVVFEELGLDLDNWFIWLVSLACSITCYYIVGIRDVVLEFLLIFSVYLAGDGYISAIMKAPKLYNILSCKILRKYIHLLLIFKTLAPAFNNLALYIITFSLYMNCMCLWVSVNCFSILPLMLVGIFMMCFVGGLGLVILLMFLLSNVRSKSIKLKYASLKTLRTSGKGTKGILWRMWISMQTLPINCGERFAFTKDAVTNYLNVLSEMLTNVFVIFKI